MATMPLIGRSILSSSRAARRLPKSSSFFLTPYHTNQNTNVTATNNTQQTILFSTSPDYTNYESWHKNNYEGESHTHHTNIPNLDILQNNFIQDENSSISNSTTTKFNHPVEGPRTSVLMELTDRVGALHDVLRFFWKYDVNITRIESRPVSTNDESKVFDFFVDFYGSLSDTNVNVLLQELKGMTDKLLVLDEKEVQWFPRHISDLDLIANRTLDAGTDLEADHPGFNDVEYRKRRAKLAEQALNHRMHHHQIPKTEYTKEEVETWGLVWDTMEELWDAYACKEYKKSMNMMKKHCNYHRDAIPQLSSISSFLHSQTNFRLRPVAGLISSRDFLNGLAFRTFFCTQYIRHPSMPLYTPEPDICHELLGHVPMFADRDFCDFSQEIGLASLGANDDDVLKLARCYWHSVEFGLCQENGKNKAYGAGLLSSFGELEYSCKEREDESEPWPYEVGEDGMPSRPIIKPWDPAVASSQDFPITTYQPVYFLAESLGDAKLKMRKYCEGLPRPFFALYNTQTETVHIDRPVRRAVGVPTPSS